MFEKQIEKVMAFISERTISSNESIKLQNILASEIIEPIKTFFSADVDEWIEEELNRLHNSPHFDYSEKTLYDLLSQVNTLSKEHAVYRRDEFAQALERGVKLLFNFTCRPQWTLSKFIFDDQQKKKVKDILSSLRFFHDYKYYHVVLEKYFSSRNLDEIQVGKFDELLELIDHEMVKNFNSHQMAELAAPMYRLFNMDVSLESATVPLEALSIFYDDKGNTAIVERLEKEKNVAGDGELSLHDLKMLINEVEFSISLEISDLVSTHVMGGTKPPATTSPISEAVHEIIDATPQVFEAEPFEEKIDSVYEPEMVTPELLEFEMPEAYTSEEQPQILEAMEFELPQVETTDEGSNTDSFPLTSSFDTPQDVQFTAPQMETDYSLESKKPVTDAVPDIALDFEKAFDETTFATPFEQTPSSQQQTENTAPDSIPSFDFMQKGIPESPITAPPQMSQPEPPRGFDSQLTDPIAKFGDLRTLISAGDKKKYIKKIFQRNDERYATAIDILNSKNTWKEASEYIDEIFLNNDVDMYSRVAVQFTDDIYKRYLPKK